MNNTMTLSWHIYCWR